MPAKKTAKKTAKNKNPEPKKAAKQPKTEDKVVNSPTPDAPVVDETPEKNDEIKSQDPKDVAEERAQGRENREKTAREYVEDMKKHREEGQAVIDEITKLCANRNVNKIEISEEEAIAAAQVIREFENVLTGSDWYYMGKKLVLRKSSPKKK